MRLAIGAGDFDATFDRRYGAYGFFHQHGPACHCRLANGRADDGRIINTDAARVKGGSGSITTDGGSKNEPEADELYRRCLAYPDDLPDLSALRPPGGNARPEGIAQSAFARRERGELSGTY